MKSNTVFGHLAIQLAAHPENWATEALSFILRNSPAASRAFTEFVRQVGPEFPRGLRFETQRGGSNQSIPDMKCHDDDGRLRVVVENKFWADLTENQPVTYLGELPPGVPALVLFVVPKARLQRVWDAVVARCSAKFSVGDIQTYTTITFADLGQGHYLAATSWTALLDALSTSANLAGEMECLNDISQLQGLCKSMDEEEFLPLRGGELTNLDMARRIINFSDLAFSILNGAVSKGMCNREGIRERNYRYGPGAFFRIGSYRPWIGFGARSWLRMGVSPIWVIFLPLPENPIPVIREKLARFRTYTPQRCFDGYGRNDGRLLVPIVLPTGVERQQIIEDAVRQIKELRDELGVQELITAHDLTTTDELETGLDYDQEAEPSE